MSDDRERYVVALDQNEWELLQSGRHIECDLFRRGPSIRLIIQREDTDLENSATIQVQDLVDRLIKQADGALLNEDHLADRALCQQAAASITELAKRLDEAHQVMVRMEKATAKKSYDPGESIEEVMEDVTKMLSDAMVERHIFGE